MKRWILSGDNPADYEIGAEFEDKKKIAYLRSKAGLEKPSGYGTLMQSFKADLYRKKRILFTGVVKSTGLEDWAGLWMRVDGPGKGDTLVLDNMERRAIRGTTEWQRYKVVLDVPEEGATIHFGILLCGKGQVWLDGVKFEEAPNEKVTGGLEDEPGNLDFLED